MSWHVTCNHRQPLSLLNNVFSVDICAKQQGVKSTLKKYNTLRYGINYKGLLFSCINLIEDPMLLVIVKLCLSASLSFENLLP